jgi:hypothetical protein
VTRRSAELIRPTAPGSIPGPSPFSDTVGGPVFVDYDEEIITLMGVYRG